MCKIWNRFLTEIDHQAIASYLAAIGTIIVALTAIWGDWIRAKFAPPKLKIDVHNLDGVPTTLLNESKAFFYQLKVVNNRSWITVKNCHVQIVYIYKRGLDDQFHACNLSFPIHLVWTPGESSPLFETITHERIFDLGYIQENDSIGFRPNVYQIPNKFEGYVGRGDAYRYSLQIIADNYVSQIQVFEVSWDGTWSDHADIMKKSLVIKEVAPRDQV
jgi:hypothetical protein